MKVEPKHLFSYLWGYSLINSLKVVILLFLRPWIQEKDYVLIRKDKSKPDDHCKSVLGKKKWPKWNGVEPQLLWLKVGYSQKNIGEIFIAKQICCFTILNFVIWIFPPSWSVHSWHFWRHAIQQSFFCY